MALSAVPVIASDPADSRFAVRLVYFDPAESGLDAKATFGADYFPSDNVRVSLDYWKQSEYDAYYDLGVSVEVMPITVTWVSRSKSQVSAPRQRQAYFGGGVGWYRCELRIWNSYDSESATESDLGFHVLAGMDVTDRAFAEVRYATADVEGLKAGGFGLSVGYRF